MSNQDDKQDPFDFLNDADEAGTQPNESTGATDQAPSDQVPEDAAPATEGPVPDETIAFETPADEPAPEAEAADDSAPSVEATTSDDSTEEDDALDFSSFGAGEDSPADIGEADAEGDEGKAEAEAEADEEDEEPKPSLLARITSVDPYSVMLGVALLAVVLGAASLLAEWASYGYDTAAEAAKSLRP